MRRLYLAFVLSLLVLGSKSESIYQRLLIEVNIHYNQPMRTLFPKLNQIKDDKIYQCYDPSLGTRVINIFKLTLIEVVEAYFVS